ALPREQLSRSAGGTVVASTESWLLLGIRADLSDMQTCQNFRQPRLHPLMAAIEPFDQRRSTVHVREKATAVHENDCVVAVNLDHGRRIELALDRPNPVPQFRATLPGQARGGHPAADCHCLGFGNERTEVCSCLRGQEGLEGSGPRWIS